MLVIGEKINATNRAVAEAIINRDEEFLVNLATLPLAFGNKI